jgi:hypothetical protein
VWQKAQLTCKDSLLVGWGGATDQDSESSSVINVSGRGVAACEGCTLQYHPDSQHMPTVMFQEGSYVQGQPDNPMPSSLVVADEHGHVDLSQCQLVGPAYRSAALTGMGVRAEAYATINLVGMVLQTPGINMLGHVKPRL